MELQVNTKDLLHILEISSAEQDDWSGKDHLLIKALIGIMERLERLQGAVLSLQK